MALSYHFPHCLRNFAFAADALFQVILATKVNSLALYSKSTVELRRAPPDYHCSISDAFNSLLRVLFNVPSRYWFAIGFETYLVLEVNGPQLPAPFPRCSTRDTPQAFFFSFTGLSPCGVLRSRKLQIKKKA